MKKFWLLTGLIALALMLFGTAPTNRVSASSLSGAIFTTTPDGSIVNENVRYEKKIEVYLDGGPGPNAPQTAAGLPDGNYIFQVTDPSGAVLLSEDPAKCREIRVHDGVIVELVSSERTYGNGNKTYPCSIQDAPNPPDGPGTAGKSGRHDTNVDTDHGPPAIVVQLMPFFDTPNNGGVYKAWATPIDTYVAKGGDVNAVPTPLKVRNRQVGYVRDPGFGPPRDQVKTDNFKVKGVPIVPPEVTVRKFHDVDADSLWDAGEPEMGLDQCVDSNGAIVSCPGGWPYDWTEPIDGGTLTSGSYYTPNTHVAAITGTYTACETLLSGWAQTALYIDGVKVTTNLCASVAVAGTSGEKHTIVFGDTMPVSVSGQKVIDYDADGTKDAEDVCPSAAADPVNNPGCAGVTVHLDGTDNLGNSVNLPTLTDASGYYEFTGVMPGSYTVSVDEPSGFYCSFPTTCNYSLNPGSGENQNGKNFGDFSLADLTGRKYHDHDGDGERDAGEHGLADWEIHLDGTAARANPVTLEGTEIHRVTWSCGGVQVPDCQGEPVGTYWFLDLVPGGYTVSEGALPNLWAQTAPDVPGTWNLQLTSDQVCEDKDFGNFGPCAGLTPGYWYNWDNHYTQSQFLDLLEGTIAAGDTALARSYLESLGCDNGDALHCMRRFLLTDQLSINLTQSDYFNEGAALIGACSVQGVGTLQSAIDDALAILANPGAYTRDQILDVKGRLAAFATK